MVHDSGHDFVGVWVGHAKVVGDTDRAISGDGLVTLAVQLPAGSTPRTMRVQLQPVALEQTVLRMLGKFIARWSATLGRVVLDGK